MDYNAMCYEAGEICRAAIEEREHDESQHEFDGTILATKCVVDYLEDIEQNAAIKERAQEIVFNSDRGSELIDGYLRSRGYNVADVDEYTDEINAFITLSVMSQGAGTTLQNNINAHVEHVLYCEFLNRLNAGDSIEMIERELPKITKGVSL
jgi:hypothetical protein